MSRVFVYEPVKADVSIAEAHGTIAYLWDDEHRRPSIWETAKFRQAVVDRLEELQYDPNDDYFAVVGPVVATTLVVTVLQERYTLYKLLFWHAEFRDYLVRRISSDY